MINIEQNNDEKLKQFVLKGLENNNMAKCEWFRENDYVDDNDYNFLAYDDEKVVGGAIGYVLYNWYFLDLLWLEESYRGKDIGTFLIKRIEEYAKEENLTGVRMETWDFQAKGFYEKMGYKVYAKIEDCPPGTIDYFFMKRFK